MICQFRYVDETSDAAVNLHLYSTINGTPRGDVRAPVSQHIDGSHAVVEASSCLPLSVAFALAIRMANRNDVEIVVLGDHTLWDAQWGRLHRIAPTNTGRDLHARDEAVLLPT